MVDDGVDLQRVAELGLGATGHAAEAHSVREVVFNFQGVLREFTLQDVEAFLGAHVHVIEAQIDKFARVRVGDGFDDVDLGLPALGGVAAQRPGFEEVFLPGRVELGIQAVQADGRRVRRAPLQRQGRADALLFMAQPTVTGDARVEQAARRVLAAGQGVGVLEAVVAAGGPPTHRAEALFDRALVAVGQRQQGAELAVHPGVGDQAGEARAPLLRQIVIAALRRGDGGEARIVERARGAQIDRRAQRTFLDLGRGGLANGDVVEQL
ncbi:hypothetical protein D3C80_1047290 [compost metagenome]